MKRMWALPTGLLLQRSTRGCCHTEGSRGGAGGAGAAESMLEEAPVFYSLTHPLDEVRPLSVFDCSPFGGGFEDACLCQVKQHVKFGGCAGEASGDSLVISNPAFRVVFSSACLPLVVLYNKVTKLHSFWLVRSRRDGQREPCGESSALQETESPAPSDAEFFSAPKKERAALSHFADGLPCSPRERAVNADVALEHLYTERLPTGTSLSKLGPATQVFFLATHEASLAVCFLIPQRGLLQFFEVSCAPAERAVGSGVSVTKTFSLPCLSAAPLHGLNPVTVHLASTPVSASSYYLLLDTDRRLSLYSMNQKICDCLLPDRCPPASGSPSPGEAHASRALPDSPALSPPPRAPLCHKILQLAHPVANRLNLLFEDGRSLRVALNLHPQHSIVSHCFRASSCTLPADVYNVFLSDYLRWHSSAHASSLSHYDSFSLYLVALSAPSTHSLPTHSPAPPHPLDDADWLYLLSSHRSRADPVLPHLFPASPPPPAHQLSPHALALASSWHLRQEVAVLKPYLNRIIHGLHLLFENAKLSTLTSNTAHKLAFTLLDLSYLLGWTNYLTHYLLFLSNRDRLRHRNRSIIPAVRQLLHSPPSSHAPPPHTHRPIEPLYKSPPSIYRWLHRCLRGIREPFPLLNAQRNPCDLTRKICTLYRVLRFGPHRQPAHPRSPWLQRARAMVLSLADDLRGLPELDSLPFGVALPIREALYAVRHHPPTNWNHRCYEIIGRTDLALQHLNFETLSQTKATLKERAHKPTAPLDHPQQPTPSQHDLLLKTLSQPFLVSDEPDHPPRDPPTSNRHDDLPHPHHPDVLNPTALMRFSRDDRLLHASKLLRSTRPIRLRLHPDAERLSELDKLNALKSQLHLRLHRNFALSVGRGMLRLSGELDTSRLFLHPPHQAPVSSRSDWFTVPPLATSGYLPGVKGSISLPDDLDLDAESTWPNFHNGVATGLYVTPSHVERLTSSWISYNRTKMELTDAHAGFLYALGLQGHLQQLDLTTVYEYLFTAHPLISAGLLLGLASCSYGTACSTTSKVLGIHFSPTSPDAATDLDSHHIIRSAAALGSSLASAPSSKTSPTAKPTLSPAASLSDSSVSAKAPTPSDSPTSTYPTDSTPSCTAPNNLKLTPLKPSTPTPSPPNSLAASATPSPPASPSPTPPSSSNTSALTSNSNAPSAKISSSGTTSNPPNAGSTSNSPLTPSASNPNSSSPSPSATPTSSSTPTSTPTKPPTSASPPAPTCPSASNSPAPTTNPPSSSFCAPPNSSSNFSTPPTNPKNTSSTSAPVKPSSPSASSSPAPATSASSLYSENSALDSTPPPSTATTWPSAWPSASSSSAAASTPSTPPTKPSPPSSAPSTPSSPPPSPTTATTHNSSDTSTHSPPSTAASKPETSKTSPGATYPSPSSSNPPPPPSSNPSTPSPPVSSPPSIGSPASASTPPGTGKKHSSQTPTHSIATSSPTNTTSSSCAAWATSPTTKTQT
ncbi:anaphase-promoting complex subunit 1-like [Schistocerca gregaria]|uniref:anaphase-promoting complex subunit 1-like n=1 Tax=Schistocerca gregaria TaxID=7010 RepID=UPI00211DB55B|nr:anaphase-promoting complex subunit 1-like [Schistocerca gregaria]